MIEGGHAENGGAAGIAVRRAVASDQQAVSRLFNLDPRSERLDDDGSDIHDLETSYLRPEEGSSLWVAQASTGDVVGMVGVRRAEDSVAQIRRLRVHADWRHRGIGARLVREALAFCTDNGYVKVILSTRVDQQAAIALFQYFGFKLNRTRSVDGREAMEFYLDLYRQSERDRS